MTEISDQNPPIKHWDLSQLVLSEEQVEIANDLHTWLAKSPTTLSQSIMRFEGGEFTNDQMRILEHEIIRQFCPLPKAAKYLQVLCKIVDSINHRSATKLPLPRIPNVAIKPKNPFRSGLPSALKLTRIWRDALSNNVSKNVAVPSENRNSIIEVQLGKVYASAVLHGGLVDPNLLVALARAIKQPKQDIFFINKRMVIELSISWQGEMGSEHRFWYPDSLTAILIAQLPEKKLPALESSKKSKSDTDQHIRKLIWHCVSIFFRTTQIKINDRPQSISKFVSNVKIDLQTRLPQVIVNYAARSIISHSPGRSVLARIYGFQQQVNSTPEDAKFAEPIVQITEFNNTSDNLADIEPSWLSRLRTSFFSKDGATILKSIDAIIAQTPPNTAEHCFALFARHLVSGRSAGNNKLAPSTARAYLATVSKRLGGRLGDVDPSKLGAETLEVLYGEILEDADIESGNRKQRRSIARALREFHHFLVKEYQSEHINVREVLGIGKGLVPVDANLITIDEYEQILLHIPKSIKKIRRNLPAQEILANAAQLIFILAFKCGLRRMEVLKLKIADLCEHKPAELLIRPSDARRLKTKSSTRKIPLYALLSDNELDDLKQWKLSRLNELEKQTPSSEQIGDYFLFGIPELNFDFIPQDTLFPILHDAMREVTGDASLRFHHLRHSFASWTFLRLMLSDLPKIPPVFRHLPKTAEILKDSVKFRNILYGRSDITRRHVFAVASLLGHSGPEMSLEHYIHFSDMVLATWLNIDLVVPTKKSIIQNAGKPRATIYRMVSQGLTDVPFRIAKNQKLITFKINSKATPATSQKLATLSPKVSLLDNPAIFDKVWDILHQHSLNHVTAFDLSTMTGLSEKVIVQFIEKASLIAEMKTERGTGGYRHRMIEQSLDRRNAKVQTRLSCPIAPHTIADKEIVQRLAPKFIYLLKNNHELCRAVFDYYLVHAWQTKNELIFKDSDAPVDAQNFLAFLDALGLKNKEIQYISFDISVRSRSLAKWKKHLGLSSRKSIIKLPPPRKGNIAAKEWLGIKPVFKDCNSSTNDLNASIAFRYLMIMGSIILTAWKDEERRIFVANF